MVIVRGVNVYPSAVEHVLRECGGIGEYQVKVRRSGVLSDLLLLVEPDGMSDEKRELSARVGKAFQDAFALRASIDVVPKGTLPRFEMKAKRWVLSDAS